MKICLLADKENSCSGLLGIRVKNKGWVVEASVFHVEICEGGFDATSGLRLKP